MTRASKFLFAAVATLALPASTAFAQGDLDGAVEEGAEGDASAEESADSSAPADGISTTTPAPAGAWSRSVIDRPVTLPTGKLGAGAQLQIARASLGPLGSATATGLGIVGGYGINDKLSVGGSYSFTLDEFEIKGPLSIYGAYTLVDNGKLTIGASADVVFNFNGSDGMGGSSTDTTIHAGLAARYKIAPQLAVFTGSPWTPGPLGQHLSLGLNEGAPKTFSIPVGVGFQATPELFAFANTTLATIMLSDPGMGDRVSFIGDLIPLTIGAFYSVTPNIDAVVAFDMPDVPSVGDLFAVTVGARYFTN